MISCSLLQLGLIVALLNFSYCFQYPSKPKSYSKDLRTLFRATKSELRSGNCELVVWDCDGVLVDSEYLLKVGEVEALNRAGFDQVTINDCVRLFSGVSVDKATENFLNEYGKPLPEGFFKEQIEGSLQLFRDRLMPLMKDTVLALHAKGVPMCVASGSPRNRVLVCLECAGIDHCFTPSTVFTREEVKRGKPAPDLFLHAASKMGVDPTKCVVIEDSSSGIEAGLAAGMKTIGYLGANHASKYLVNFVIRLLLKFMRTNTFSVFVL